MLPASTDLSGLDTLTHSAGAPARGTHGQHVRTHLSERILPTPGPQPAVHPSIHPSTHPSISLTGRTGRISSMSVLCCVSFWSRLCWWPICCSSFAGVCAMVKEGPFCGLTFVLSLPLVCQYIAAASLSQSVSTTRGWGVCLVVCTYIHSRPTCLASCVFVCLISVCKIKPCGVCAAAGVCVS